MQNNPNQHVDKMYQSCVEKCKLLEQMLKLTKKQTEIIDQQEFEELMKVIEEKQKKINEINVLDEAFNNELQQLKDILKVKSLDEVERDKKIVDSIFLGRLKDVINDIVELTKQIADVEKANSESAGEVYKQLSEKLKDINKGKKLKTAYSNKNDAPSVYFDEKK